jgi:hypothetical protein
LRCARQAQNTEAERQACEIRLRAERKCGEMLAEQFDRTGRGRPEKASTDPRLSDLGISYDQSSQWQRLAAIPAEESSKLTSPVLCGAHPPAASGVASDCDRRRQLAQRLAETRSAASKDGILEGLIAVPDEAFGADAECRWC